MALVDELQKLSELHRSGALTDDEYARAKAMLLAGPLGGGEKAPAAFETPASSFAPAEDPIFARSDSAETPLSLNPEHAQESPPAPPRRRQMSARFAGASTTEQVRALRYEEEVARIDREWEMERVQYLVRGRYGSANVPTVGDVAGPAFVAAFGVFWCVMAFSITRGAPGDGGFALVKVIFPLFGVVFTGIAIFHVFANWNKLNEYRRASDAWQARRNSVRR